MLTPANIDTALVEDAVKAGHFESAEAAVNQALREYVDRHRTPVPGAFEGDPQEIIDLFGTIDFDPEWDYKEMRRRDLKRIPKDDDC